MVTVVMIGGGAARLSPEMEVSEQYDRRRSEGGRQGQRNSGRRKRRSWRTPVGGRVSGFPSLVEEKAIGIEKRPSRGRHPVSSVGKWDEGVGVGVISEVVIVEMFGVVKYRYGRNWNEVGIQESRGWDGGEGSCGVVRVLGVRVRPWMPGKR
jgi:hypothetical protein